MIKAIAKIKGLGVYQNYTKPAGTQDFAVKNLIYGWNYSGKTTLSRLFAQLETKTPNPDLGGCEFSFETNDQPITEKVYQQCDLTVRVFNSDFVRANLHFDGGGFNPILLLGRESEEAQEKIDRLIDRNKKSGATRRKIDNKLEGIDAAIADAKTAAAKNIRQLLKIDPYTATHLGNDALAVGVLDSQLLSEKELTDNLELALTPDNKKPTSVDELLASPSIDSLHKEAVAVLEATPSFSNTIQHLEDNPSIERWVETGLHIHTAAGPCEFCGNTVTNERLDAFRAHFSKDLANHKQKVEGLLKRVQSAEFKLDLPKEVEFNPQFRDAYREAAVPLPTAIAAFNQAVKTLAEDVQRKVNDSRKAMAPAPLGEGLARAITDIVATINALIKSNNELAANFNEARTEAQRKVKYHYVQQFIDAQKAAGHDSKKDRLVKRNARVKTYAEKMQPEIAKLQALISQAQRGREKINERLASMLGSEALQIEVFNDSVSNQERFRLVRKNAQHARNISEGERTAIAFSYFLTKLQELQPEQFEETIVYIDDPVSSLDANHIFQVNAAINDLFFHKVKNAQGNESWSTSCKQLFVATHNFEFFNLLRELKPDGDNQSRLYLVKRTGDLLSTFGNMPKSLSRYGSEYQFLFDKIYAFHNAADKTDHDLLMMLPNAVRRFLELYTYSRIPGGYKETVDQRAIDLFGKEKSKCILKFLHTFSHANTIERLAGNNELIFLLDQTVKDLFDEIEQNDKRHWNALRTAVQL